MINPLKESRIVKFASEAQNLENIQTKAGQGKTRLRFKTRGIKKHCSKGKSS